MFLKPKTYFFNLIANSKTYTSTPSEDKIAVIREFCDMAESTDEYAWGQFIEHDDNYIPDSENYEHVVFALTCPKFRDRKKFYEGVNKRIDDVCAEFNETRAEFMEKIAKPDWGDHVVLAGGDNYKPLCFSDYDGDFIIYGDLYEASSDCDVMKDDKIVRVYDWLKSIGIAE